MKPPTSPMGWRALNAYSFITLTTTILLLLSPLQQGRLFAIKMMVFFSLRMMFSFSSACLHRICEQRYRRFLIYFNQSQITNMNDLGFIYLLFRIKSWILLILERWLFISVLLADLDILSLVDRSSLFVVWFRLRDIFWKRPSNWREIHRNASYP